MNSWWRWRCMQRPITVPSSTLSAANKVVAPVALVIVRHGLPAPRLDGQPRLSAVECLDLAFFIEREHHGMRRRIDIEVDDVGELSGKAGIARAFEGSDAVRLYGSCAWQMRCIEGREMSIVLAIAQPAQWVA